MTTHIENGSEREERLHDLVAEYIEAVEAGQAPDRGALLDRYPEYSDKLAEFFAARDQLAYLTPPRPATFATEHGELGDFRILRLVGRGGMGIVYEAEQISLRRRVALKVLPFAATMDPRQLQRFQNEARAAASLQHPHIVPVHAVGCERGVHYYAMQFIDGQTLADLICQLRGLKRPAQSGELPTPPSADTVEEPRVQAATEPSVREPAYFRRVAEWGIQAAEALEHAHALGIVHRDVKPANLMVDAQGTLWVTDFGLARTAADNGMTMTGDVLGTLRYMSPEQALAKHGLVDHRTDVYSLGVTLYELLTLRPAIDGKDRQEIQQQVAAEEPQPPRRINRAMPKELETILLKAMAKNPAERYVTAREFAEDLRRFLEDKPIRARRPTMLQRARKWAQRHRSVVRAVGVTLLLGAIVSAWQAVRATLAEKDARGAETDARKAESDARRAEWDARKAEADALAERNRAVKAEADAKEQRDRALTAMKAATESEADTKAFSDFLVEDVLIVARPEGEAGGLGINVTVKQALDAAAPKIGERFRGRPRAEAIARHDLGVTYRRVGDLDAAEEQLRRALALRREVLGADHRDTLSTLNSLAVLLYGRGKNADAQPLFKEVLELQKATLGPDHPNTLNTLTNLATSYATAGQWEEALPLMQDAVRGCQARLGPDHPYTLRSMNNLAEVYQLAGRRSEALKLFETTTKAREAALGPDHPDTLSSMNNLARAYQAAGRLTDALPLFEAVLKGRRAKLGPDHPFTLMSMINLAAAYEAAEMRSKALPLFEEALKGRRAKLGPDHPATLNTLTNLADAYLAAGQLPKAIPLYAEAFKLKEAKFGPDREETRAACFCLAVAYQLAERYADAEPLFTRMVASLRRQSGHPLLRPVLLHLGECQVKTAKHVEAESVLRECLKIYEKQGADSFLRFAALSALGGSLTGQKKYAEAESFLLQGYEGMKARGHTPEAKNPDLGFQQRLTAAVERLVQLYEAWGQPEQAAQWRKRLEASKGNGGSLKP